MKPVHTALLLVLILPLLGCGSEELPYTDNSQDPELFAQDMKELVYDHAHAARRSKEPADELELLANALEDMKGRPVGGYADVYTQLQTQASAAYAAAEQAGGKPSGLEGMLKEIEETAEKLPGPKPIIRD